MLLPESMSRIVIVGSASRLDDTIEVLYGLRSIHLIDNYNDSDAGFSIGSPRPYSSKASERLLKIRAVEKELDVNEKKETYPISAEEIRRQIDAGDVEAVDKDVFKTIDERNQVAQTLAELKSKKADLTLLSQLPIPLDVYKGYGALAVMVGTVKADPSAALSNLKDSEFFVSNDKKLIALFIKKENKEEAQHILADAGFVELSVPEGTGTPQENLDAIEGSIVKLVSEQAKLDAAVSELRELHEAFALATEEELALTVEKGEFPLRIGTSDFSFVVDAWVPTCDIASMEEGLKAKLGESVYISVEEERDRSLHTEEHAEKRFKRPPTKQKNGIYAKRFEYPTQLVSTPKYQEIDPSAIMAVLFPIFFGLMVGDLGYAIPFIILGAYGLKVAKSDEFKAIATILFFGGIWAAIFGFFLFGEMLGMHFVGHADGANITWEALLGIDLPGWFKEIMVEGHGISKTSKDWVPFMLKLSVYIGVMHLLFSYIMGFINIRMQHGTKEAFFEKGGWIMTFIGLVILCYTLTEVLFSKAPWEGTLLYMTIGSAVLLAAGVVISFQIERAQAILEVPGLIGNVLSYTRLVAVGMSKAGMAMAFNYIGLVMLAGFGGEVTLIGVVFGALVFIVGHLMIWTLAIITAGLHALRLQYVESMNKFFTGGGVEYTPLSTKRKHTKVVETEV